MAQKVVMSKDEFVDLYAMLDLPADASAEQLRSRINALYIEAQQNLDHRNIKKRLHYQHLYEIYLPQARHLLLDAKRRAEYNEYLAIYRSEQEEEPEEATAPRVAERAAEVAAEEPQPPGKITFSFDDEPLPAAAVEPEEVDPEKVAVEREQMWSRWKEGLEHVAAAEPQRATHAPATGSGAAGSTAGLRLATADTATAGAPPKTAPPKTAPPKTAPPRSAPPKGATSAAATPATSTSATSAPVAPTRHVGQAPPATHAPHAPHTADGSTHAPEVAEGFERQRQNQRIALIRAATENASLLWGWGTGLAVFVIGCLVFLIVDNHLVGGKYPLGLSRSLFAALCFIVIVIAAAIGGYYASRFARQRTVAELSSLSLEDLLRRTR